VIPKKKIPEESRFVNEAINKEFEEIKNKGIWK
jgi:hypothetical protein